MGNIQDSLLSIVVPVYNVGNYIQECIESIIEQTYKNLEIIIVDDGSTDHSGRICDEYADKDSRVRVIHTENKGLLSARFTGVEESNGKYVTFVDSDDWIDKAMYEDLMYAIESSHAEIVVSGICRYWNKDKMIYDKPCLEEKLYKKHDIKNQVLPVMLWNKNRGRQELDPSLCTKVFEKRILKKYLQNVQELGIYLGEDTSVIYPMMLDIDSMVVVRKCYYYHRQRMQGEVASYLSDHYYFERLYRLYIYLKKMFEKSDYSNELLKELDYFYMRFVQLRRECYVQTYEIDKYLFPYNAIPYNSDIILYGAGSVGISYMEQNNKYHFCNIILWIDKKAEEFCGDDRKIYLPEEIKHYKYDYILIAVHVPELAKEIMEELEEMGIGSDKIIWFGTTIYKFAE